MDDDNSEAKFREKFESRIKSVDIDGLPAFINEMLAEPMDYGTICLAIGFAGAAAAWAVEKSPQGGITGFQAGCIGWELLRQWGSPGLGKTGTRLLDYDNLLFPQYGDKFRCISPEVWSSVQDEAGNRLAKYAQPEGDEEPSVHPAVLDHWRSIVRGEVPFGLTVATA